MPPRVVYALVTVFVTVVALAVLNVLYTNHVDSEAEKRNVQRSREICGLIKLIDDVNQQQPAPPAGPNAETVKAYRAELHRYRVALGC